MKCSSFNDSNYPITYYSNRFHCCHPQRESHRLPVYHEMNLWKRKNMHEWKFQICYTCNLYTVGNCQRHFQLCNFTLLWDNRIKRFHILIRTWRISLALIIFNSLKIALIFYDYSINFLYDYDDNQYDNIDGELNLMMAIHHNYHRHILFSTLLSNPLFAQNEAFHPFQQ